MSSSPAVFLDANILIEIILCRPQQKLARDFLSQHADLSISALTAHLAVHFGQPIVELPVLREFLADYVILPLEQTDFAWAFSNIRNKDFEDALQLAVAIRNGCDRLVTFDKNLANTYKSLVQIKVELLS